MKGITISTQDRNTHITDYPLQDFYFIPVEKTLYIKRNDFVQEGQLLTENTDTNEVYHSPVSGTITDILTYQHRQYIEIKRNPQTPPKKYTLSPTKGVPTDILIKRVKDAGISNDIHFKLSQALKKTKYLVLNGLDTEPFVTNTNSILTDKIYELIQSITLLRYMLDAENIFIAISKNTTLKKHIESFLINNKNIKIIEVQKKYPLHNEKLLVNYIFKKKLGKFDSSLQENIFVVDTHTTYALYNAIFFQKPLTEKIISVDGAYSLTQGNFNVKIGTPISAFMRPFSVESSYVMFAGGPLTGKTLEKEKSLTKQIDAIMIFEGKPTALEAPCIFCNACVLSCPINLEPIKLVDFIQNQEFDKAEEYYIKECIQCNICTYICPSFIPLGSIINSYIKGANQC